MTAVASDIASDTAIDIQSSACDIWRIVGSGQYMPVDFNKGFCDPACFLCRINILRLFLYAWPAILSRSPKSGPGLAQCPASRVCRGAAGGGLGGVSGDWGPPRVRGSRALLVPNLVKTHEEPVRPSTSIQSISPASVSVFAVWLMIWMRHRCQRRPSGGRLSTVSTARPHDGRATGHGTAVRRALAARSYAVATRVSGSGWPASSPAASTKADQ